MPDVIQTLNDPMSRDGATAVLTGNLAPRGCVMKPSAAEKRLLKHRGKVIAFEDYNHMAREIDRDDLDVTADHILVLKNAGPKGGPGMPEWGMLPIPTKLREAGRARHAAHLRCAHERHQLRRLHPARRAGELCRRPARFRAEPATRSRSTCRRARSISHVSDDELAKRKAAWNAPPPRYQRGYGAMFSEHIGQADQGCDFDFLQAGAPMPEPEIH